MFVLGEFLVGKNGKKNCTINTYAFPIKHFITFVTHEYLAIADQKGHLAHSSVTAKTRPLLIGRKVCLKCMFY